MSNRPILMDNGGSMIRPSEPLPDKDEIMRLAIDLREAMPSDSFEAAQALEAKVNALCEALAEAKDEIAETNEVHAEILKEACSIDYGNDNRSHCTCVPFLRKALVEAQKDALRYRWLRDCGPSSFILTTNDYSQTLDAAVDAAIAASKEGK